MAGRYALIVANGAYRDPKLSRLRTPTTDAERLAGVLRDPRIGDFDVELSVDEPEHVLRRKIASFFAERQRDDLLLLHFSCHGLKDDSGQLYFAAPDTDVAQLEATALSAEFVSRQMTRSRSRKVIALLDCCYSGAFARGLRFRGGDQVDLDDHLGGHGRVILTASSAMEYAFEGEELTGTGNPSVFTTAVVKGLETGEADRDQDHRISVEELYDYVCEQVREITPDQSPNMLSHLEGELYVARSSYVVPVAPAELPRELTLAMESPLSGVREGAVSELAVLAGGSDPAMAEAARRALQELTDDDSRRVAAAAQRVLGVGEAAAPRPPARPEAAPHSAEAGRAATQAGDVAAPAPVARRRRALAPALAGLGALLVFAGMLVAATERLAPALKGMEVVSLAAAAVAAALALLRATRAAGGDRPGLELAVVVLAGIPLGCALAAEALEDDLGSTFSEGLVAAGALLIGAGGLVRTLRWAPRRPPRAASAVTLAAAAGLLLAIVLPWKDGQSVFTEVEAALGLLLIATAAVAAAAGVAGLRGASRATVLLAPLAPAAGLAALAAALTIYGWAIYSSYTLQAGAALTVLAGLAAAVAGCVAALRTR